MITRGARCRFCLLVIASAPPFCGARALIPGERFPHEPESDGDRMTRANARYAGQRMRSGFGSKRRPH
jgi:hypothetical protein